MMLDELLNKSNSIILSEFKWGTEGEKLFHEFMNAVRHEMKRKDQLEESMDKIFKVADSFEWHFRNHNTPEGYISSTARKAWLDR